MTIVTLIQFTQTAKKFLTYYAETSTGALRSNRIKSSVRKSNYPKNSSNVSASNVTGITPLMGKSTWYGEMFLGGTLLAKHTVQRHLIY